MSIYDDYVRWMQGGGAVTQSQAAKDAAAKITYPASGSAKKGGQSPLEWGIDMISRPLYGVTGYLTKSIERGQSGTARAISDALKQGRQPTIVDAILGSLSENPVGEGLAAGARGVFSTNRDDKKTGTDIIDQIARGGVDQKRTALQATGLSEEAARQVAPDYVAPVFGRDASSVGEGLLAMGRGVGGFALDVALDPLTYGTLGIGKLAKLGMQGAKKGIDAAKVSSMAKQLTKTGMPAAEARTTAEEMAAAAAVAKTEAKAAKVASKAQAKVEKNAGLDAAAEAVSAAPVVTKRLAKNLGGAAAEMGRLATDLATAPSNQRLVGGKAESLTEALLSANRKLDEAAAAAPTPKIPKAAAAKVEAAPAEVSMVDFARNIFKNTEDTIAVIGGKPVGTAGLYKGLSTGTPAQRQAFVRALGQAAKDPAAHPKLRQFVDQWSQHVLERRATKGTAAPAETMRAVDEALPTAVEDTLQPGSRDALLRSVLRKGERGLTDEGKALKAAIGPALFNKLTARTGAAPAAAAREQMWNDLTKLAVEADSLSPTTFDGLHENVRRFVEDRLGLRREDFDVAARQKELDYALEASKPRVGNKKTQKNLDPEALRGVSVLTGKTPEHLANEAYATARDIVGDTFDPKKEKWRGKEYHYRDGVDDFVVTVGQIDRHAMGTAIIGARAKIDEAVPKVKYTVVENGKKVEKFEARAADKRRARRNGIPELGVLSIRDTVGKWEDALIDGGKTIGLHVDGEFVPLRPTAMYDSAEEIVKQARAAGNVEEAIKLNELVNVVLYNPGTAVPDTLFFEAMGRYLTGAGTEADLVEILTRNVVERSGKTIERNPLYAGYKGKRLNNKNLYTSDQLVENTLELMARIGPMARERSAGMVREYIDKSLSDASAIASLAEREFADEWAKGEGPALAYLGRLTDRVTELGAEYGASTHALALAAEEMQKQLPTWAVKRAESIRSTQNNLRNAAKKGKTAKESADAGARSEARNTPVDEAAAVSDAEWIESAARAQAEATGETLEEAWGVGSKVADTEIKTRSLMQQMTHAFRTGFDQHYGAVVDDVNMLDFARGGYGNPAKDIFYRDAEIAAWGKKYRGLPVGAGDETVDQVAWKLLRDGTEEVPEAVRALPNGELIAAALDELRPIGNYFFDVHSAGLTGDMFWRSGTTNITYLKQQLKLSGTETKYGAAAALDDAYEVGMSQDWWRTVDVSDPVDFLTRYNKAVHSALGQRASMLALLEKLKGGGLVSDVAKPGFARPHLNGDSFFYAGLQESGLYFDVRVLDAMSAVDKRLFSVTKYGGANPMETMLDPILSAWKTGMTIYRPGHHIRNVLSNGMLSYIAEGPRNLRKSGMIAARLLARREGNTGLEGVSEVERLLRGEAGGLSKGGKEVVVDVKTASGQPLKITFDDLNDAASLRGVFRTFQQSENIVEGRGAIQKAADIATLKGTKLQKTVGGLSEGLDHHGYLQQFVQIVMNNADKVGTKQFRSLGDLYDYAINRAYKFHPDSMVLTPFEKSTMRRLIPFYTWFKGTLPAVIESTAKNPGRVAVAHKASFNIAEMFGLDPTGFDDQWNDDMEVPDYLKEGVFGANFKIGDQAFVINPGFAHQDLAKMVFGRSPEEGGNFVTATLSNTWRSLLGMLNPLLRAPIELSVKEKLESGQKIQNTGDYIDESLPVINYLTSGTGISFTNNLVHPDQAIEQGRPIERSQVQRGYQASIFDEGLSDTQGLKGLNWLFGQGAQKANTKEQAAAEKDLRKQRVAAREEAGLPTGSKSSSSAASGARSNGSKGAAASASPQVTFPEGIGTSLPARAELDPAAASAMQQVLEGSSDKKMTPAQVQSLMKSLQEDALRRQNAMYSPAGFQEAFTQIQQANPSLSFSQVMSLTEQLVGGRYK